MIIRRNNNNNNNNNNYRGNKMAMTRWSWWWWCGWETKVWRSKCNMQHNRKVGFMCPFRKLHTESVTTSVDEYKKTIYRITKNRKKPPISGTWKSAAIRLHASPSNLTRNVPSPPLRVPCKCLPYPAAAELNPSSHTVSVIWLPFHLHLRPFKCYPSSFWTILVFRFFLL
jgi:hypothetical protein